jgi:hypothetical protein
LHRMWTANHLSGRFEFAAMKEAANGGGLGSIKGGQNRPAPECTTPPERNMIARRRWFRYWVPQIPQQGCVGTGRAKVQ